MIISARLIPLVVDESEEPPVDDDDVVADVVVGVLCDYDQPHHLIRRGRSKTDLNKVEEDGEDEEVLVMLEVLFAGCPCRSQRYGAPEAGENRTTATHSLSVHWKPLLVLQHLRPQHS